MNLNDIKNLTGLSIGNITLIKVGDLIFLKNGAGNLYINEFGKIWSHFYIKPEFGLPDWQAAVNRANQIITYFQNEMPEEHIREWYRDIIVDEDPADIEDYTKFTDLLLQKKWAEADEYMDGMDTFLREGISIRIMYEIEKNLEENIKKD